MSALTNEYLDDLIKKKLFKDFSLWEKDDFHFLLTLLNYPNYTDLALVILSNLKNWITYSNGIFFYPIEKLQKILDKYYVQKDIFEEVNDEQNIKMNIQKKNTKTNNSDDILNIDLDNGLINIGDFMSIDTFKFLICTIVFFIIFSVINLVNYNSSNHYTSNDYQKRWNKPFFKNYLSDFQDMNQFDEMFNLHENNDNDQTFSNLFEKFPKNESIVKTILKYLTRYIL